MAQIFLPCLLSSQYRTSNCFCILFHIRLFSLVVQRLLVRTGYRACQFPEVECVFSSDFSCGNTQATATKFQRRGRLEKAKPKMKTMTTLLEWRSVPHSLTWHQEGMQHIEELDRTLVPLVSHPLSCSCSRHYSSRRG